MPLRIREPLSKAHRDNKSSLSYWPGVSIAGATKHIPGYATVPVPTKTALNTRNETSGAYLNQELKARAVGADAQPTSYAQHYVINPHHDYSVDPRQGHRGTEVQQLPAPLVEPKPFLGESTYQAELAAGRRGSSSSPARQQPLVAPVAKPGYLTQYAAASLPLQQKLAAAQAGWARQADRGSPTASGGGSSGGVHPNPAAHGPEGIKASSLAGACVVMSRFDGDTTNGKMYSMDGQGNATEELNKGTAKSSPHVPGYGGHVPSEVDLMLAGLSTRVKKEDALLFHLDQHSRGLVPGYTGHKPAHRAAVRLEPPAPTAATTQGAAHLEALRWRDQAVPRAAINSRVGVLSFFSTGSSPFVSENGLAEAALFHKNKARPYEGLMKIPHSPSTTKYGAKFTTS